MFACQAQEQLPGGQKKCLRWKEVARCCTRCCTLVRACKSCESGKHVATFRVHSPKSSCLCSGGFDCRWGHSLLSSVLQHSPCMCRESFILLSMDRHNDLQACSRGPMEKLSRRIERPSMFDAHSVRVSSAVQLVKAECDAPVRRCTTYRSHMHALSSAPPVRCSKQLLHARSHTPWRERRVVYARAHASMAQVLDTPPTCSAPQHALLYSCPIINISDGGCRVTAAQFIRPMQRAEPQWHSILSFSVANL